MGSETEIKRGWWTLSYTGVEYLGDFTEQHIAESIMEGNRQGEIVQEEAINEN